MPGRSSVRVKRTKVRAVKKTPRAVKVKTTTRAAMRQKGILTAIAKAIKPKPAKMKSLKRKVLGVTRRARAKRAVSKSLVHFGR